jgi:hypothetical protein
MRLRPRLLLRGVKGPDWPGLQTKEEKMISIKTAFGRAASGDSGISTFWLLVWAIVILDDAQRRDKRKKRDRDASPPPSPKPPAGPCP